MYMSVFRLEGPLEPHQINAVKLGKAHRLFRTLLNPKIRRIMKVLGEHKEMTVTEIEIALRTESQDMISQYLSMIRRLGIVKYSSVGKYHYYRLNHDRIYEINEALKELKPANQLMPVA